MRKGFTLIELLIVIAIIAILAAIAIPQFARYRRRAYNSAALSDLDQIKLAATTYSTDHMVFPAFQNSPVQGEVVLVDNSGNGVNLPAAGNEPTVPLSTGVFAAGSQSGTGASAVYGTVHLQGDEAYGYDTDETAIFFREVAPGTNDPGIPAATDNTDDLTGAGWNKK